MKNRLILVVTLLGVMLAACQGTSEGMSSTADKTKDKIVSLDSGAKKFTTDVFWVCNQEKASFEVTVENQTILLFEIFRGEKYRSKIIDNDAKVEVALFDGTTVNGDNWTARVTINGDVGEVYMYVPAGSCSAAAKLKLSS